MIFRVLFLSRIVLHRYFSSLVDHFITVANNGSGAVGVSECINRKLRSALID